MTRSDYYSIQSSIYLVGGICCADGGFSIAFLLIAALFGTADIVRSYVDKKAATKTPEAKA